MYTCLICTYVVVYIEHTVQIIMNNEVVPCMRVYFTIFQFYEEIFSAFFFVFFLIGSCGLATIVCFDESCHDGSD